jgi:hypothetical protein
MAGSRTETLYLFSLSYCPLLNQYYAYDLFETTYQYIIQGRKNTTIGGKNTAEFNNFKIFYVKRSLF